jgi:membrane-bound lytic murein transglycosylase D
MKFLWTFTLLCIASMVMAMKSGDTHLNNFPNANSNAEFAIVKSRVLSMESIVPIRFDSEVEGYLRGFLTYGRRDASRILEFAEIYFPIIEYQLRLFNMPEDLKYLPVIESSLTPYAVSTAGAAGLWQLRRSLGSWYGLEINYYMDERRDPYKSTQVALQYLQKLYKRFGSWELALAAYNAGPTKVAKAIKLAGTRDFWKLRPYLPRETAKFVPRFIAAKYFMENHTRHGIYPSNKYAAMKDSRPVSVYHKITFAEISNVTGISTTLLKKLNPVFFRNVVPDNPKGNYVSLPKLEAIKLSQHLNRRCNILQEQEIQDLRTVKSPTASVGSFEYKVKSGDSLSKIGRKYGVTVSELKRWNNISGTIIYIDQVLQIKGGTYASRA